MADLDELLQTEPTTPDELQALKDARRAKRSQRQTMTNLVYAIIASVGVVLLLWFVVVRPDGNYVQPIDYPTVAEQAALETPWIAVPALPDGWRVNAAELRSDETDGELLWYLGAVIGDTGFVGMEQRLDAADTWAATVVETASPTGTVDVRGVQWTVYDRTDDRDAPGNLRYAMSAVIEGAEGASTVVLYGAAAESDFQAMADAVVDAIENGPER